MPNPPLMTRLLLPRGDQLKPKRGEKFIVSMDGKAWFRLYPMSDVYGTPPAPAGPACTLGSDAQSDLKFSKQLCWQTGLELCSMRIARVKVRLDFTFHVSIP